MSSMATKIRMALHPYHFKIVYKPGKELMVADHLTHSYLADSSNNYYLELETHVGAILKSYRVIHEKFKEIIDLTERYEVLVKVGEYIKNGWPQNKNQVNSLAKAYF